MYSYSFFFWQTFNRAKPEHVSQFWQNLNKSFLLFIDCSWIVYTSAAIIIAICAYFYLSDRRRRSEIVERRHILQRAQERPPQKRRPGAAYRDHQIYRHIIQTVSKYMKNPPELRPQVNEQINELRRTRSGLMHGR